jgi:hypothetical protein
MTRHPGRWHHDRDDAILSKLEVAERAEAAASGATHDYPRLGRVVRLTISTRRADPSAAE